MRLLFVAVTPPLPANNGQSMRVWSLLRALAAEGHQIEMLAFTPPCKTAPHSEELAKVCRSMEVVSMSLPPWSSGGNYMGHFWSLFSPIPYGVNRFRSELMAERITTRLRGNFDAVIVDSIFTAINVPDKMKAPLIVDQNNIEHLILERYLREQHNPLLRAYAWLEGRKLQYWERAVGARSSVLILCSENDRSIMARMCPTVRLAVVPNTIAVDAYRVAPACESARVMYLGCMDWFPNRDAVKFFIEDILPNLKKTVPNVSFTVAFSPEHAPPRRFRERFVTVSGVEFLESHNVSAELERAAVLVVPLRIGSGTRFKILEACAMGIPVVSTQIGAEGLNFRNGKEILLEDNPEKFARAITVLLADSSKRAALGKAARARVEQYYGFDVLRATISEVLAQITSGRGLVQEVNFLEKQSRALVPASELHHVGDGR